MPTLLGRGFLPSEYGSDRHEVVLVSQHLWQQKFGGDSRIIGAPIKLNGQTFTVVGIMPTTFDVPSGVDIWLPKTN
jgi:putative ABC transport system permease protein